MTQNQPSRYRTKPVPLIAKHLTHSLNRATTRIKPVLDRLKTSAGQPDAWEL